VIADECPVGEGTVNIAAVKEMMLGKTLDLPRNPPSLAPFGDRLTHDGIMAIVNRHRLLARLLREISIRYKPKRRRGNQQARDKLLVVGRAALFFRQHSTQELTIYVDGPFVKFCKRFYKTVTGMPPGPSGLEKLIRKELKKPTFET
jgi:hypothetical protein